MSTRTRTRRAGAGARAAAATIVLAVVAVATAMALGKPSPAEVSDRFWNSTWANGTFQTYPDAGLAAEASDAVVVGRIESIEQGREVMAVPEFGEDGVLSFSLARVKVEDVLAGSAVLGPDGYLALELFMPRPGALPDLQASLPEERTLLFLRLSPSGGKGVYALLNPETIVRDINGGRTLVWAEEPWLAALGDMPFETIVESVRAEL